MDMNALCDLTGIGSRPSPDPEIAEPPIESDQGSSSQEAAARPRSLSGELNARLRFLQGIPRLHSERNADHNADLNAIAGHHMTDMAGWQDRYLSLDEDPGTSHAERNRIAGLLRDVRNEAANRGLSADITSSSSFSMERPSIEDITRHMFAVRAYLLARDEHDINEHRSNRDPQAELATFDQRFSELAGRHSVSEQRLTQVRDRALQMLRGGSGAVTTVMEHDLQEVRNLVQNDAYSLDEAATIFDVTHPDDYDVISGQGTQDVQTRLGLATSDLDNVIDTLLQQRQRVSLQHIAAIARNRNLTSDAEIGHLRAAAAVSYVYRGIIPRSTAAQIFALLPQDVETINTTETEAEELRYSEAFDEIEDLLETRPVYRTEVDAIASDRRIAPFRLHELHDFAREQNVELRHMTREQANSDFSRP